MADVGFDSEKHALTRGDIERGGESLGDSSQALGRMIEAQKPEYWSEEGGFQAMRSALVSYLETEDNILRRQKKYFVKFQGNVDTAAEAFTAHRRDPTRKRDAGAARRPLSNTARRRLRRPERRRARHRAGSEPAVGHLRGTRRNPHG